MRGASACWDLRWLSEALRTATRRGSGHVGGYFLLGLACFHGRFDVTFGPDLGSVTLASLGSRK